MLKTQAFVGVFVAFTQPHVSFHRIFGSGTFGKRDSSGLVARPILRRAFGEHSSVESRKLFAAFVLDH